MTIIKLEGKIHLIKFHNPDNGYTVMLIKSGKEFIDAIGNTIGLEEGEEVELDGEYGNHKKFGTQFVFKTCIKVMPKSKLDLIDYIANNIKGVGKKIARNIVNTFEDDTINIIKNTPFKLAEIKGLNEEKIENMKQHFNEEWEKWNTVSFLANFGISVVIATKIFSVLKQDTIEIVKNNPYSLLEFVKNLDFNTVDNIGLNSGITKDNESRVNYGLLHVLYLSTEFGHTCIEESILIDNAIKILDVGNNEIVNSLVSLSKDEKIYIKEINNVKYAFRKAFYIAEKNIAEYIFKSNKKPLKKDHFKEIDEAAKKQSLVLSDEQANAINTSLNNTFTIISRRSRYTEKLLLLNV